jgi:mannose-6-phosphate isomerase-like protein (cupin superfamily)
VSADPLVVEANAVPAGSDGGAYRELTRVAALSLGLFSAGAGHQDTQQPHHEDEVYVVVSGTAVLVIDGTRTPVATGSIAYVPAGVPHRFEEIGEDLQVVVVFAPPES